MHSVKERVNLIRHAHDDVLSGRAKWGPSQLELRGRELKDFEQHNRCIPVQLIWELHPKVLVFFFTGKPPVYDNLARNVDLPAMGVM